MKLDIQRFAVTKTTTFSESNLSTTNNTSSLTIKIYFSANNTSTWFSSETLYCTCNGVTQSAKVAHPKGGSTTKSFTFNNIAHNSDGSKSVSWSWNCNTGTSVLGNVSASGTKALTKIDRQSMFDTTGWDQNTPVDLTDPIEFKITQYLNNVYHKLTAYIMDSNETLQSVAVRNNITIVNGKYSLEFTNSELENNVYPLITSSSTKFIRVYLSTYTDSELTQKLGDDSIIWYTGQVPNTIVPSVSIGTLTEADTTMISKNWGVFVQNKSKLNIPITATGIYGSTIQSIVTTINGLNFTGTPVITPVLVTSGVNTITTTVTDSRGYTATDTKTYTVVPYSNPNIQIAQVQRCLSDGTLSDNGTYLLYDFKGSISPVSNNNTALYRIGYKRTTASTYTYVTISTNYDINLADVVSSFTIDSDYPYDIKFEATDDFTTSSIDRDIDTGFDLLNFNASGKAMAIGKVSEAGANDELLEVNLPTEFLKDIDAQDITANDLNVNDITANDVTGSDASFDSIQLNSNDLEDLLFYKSGDVIELGSTDALTAFVIDGYISNSSKDLYMSIPVPKRLDKITTITAVSINVEARGHDGYLNATGGYVEYVGESGYSFYIDKSSENTIKFRIQKSTAWTKSGGTATNNVPISLAGYFKFQLS